MIVYSVKELNAELLKRIGKAEKEIVPLMQEAIALSANRVVYQAGTPEWYQRRYDRGGLVDDKNMPSESSYNGRFYELDVYDRAPFNGRKPSGYDHLATMLEYGYGTRSEWYNQPRPFMSAAQELFNDKMRGRVVSVLNKYTGGGIS